MNNISPTNTVNCLKH